MADCRVEEFWRRVEAGVPPEGEPSARCLAEAFAALLRLDGEGAREALSRLDTVPSPWKPVWRLAQLQHETLSPDFAELRAGAAALERLLEELSRDDPSWGRAAHLRAALALRLTDAAAAERWAAEALASLPETATQRRTWTLDTAATALARQGAWVEARATYAAVVEQKRKLGDRLGIAISAGNWGRMELDLGMPGQAREVLGLVPGPDASQPLPPRTRLRLRTLDLEARVAAGAPTEDAATAVKELLREVGDAHYLSGYGHLALARWNHAHGGSPAESMDRAGRSLTLPLGQALLAFWRRRLSEDASDSEAWLNTLEPYFQRLGGCTFPEVLAYLYTAEQIAPAAPERAAALLETLSRRIGESNNPFFFERLNAVGEAIDPRGSTRRRLRRFLGAEVESLTDTRRTEATIVFADLVGFTKRSVELSPELVMDTVRSVFELAAPLMREQHIEPLQYLGDGLLAMAVGPAHGSRAMAFARSFVARMHRVSAIRAALGSAEGSIGGMNIRCGVATGPVVVGPIGSLLRTERLAIGLTTNRAARLQGYADPDEIVCDASLAETGERLILEPKGLGRTEATRVAFQL